MQLKLHDSAPKRSQTTAFSRMNSAEQLTPLERWYRILSQPPRLPTTARLADVPAGPAKLGCTPCDRQKTIFL
jgi:hypothetical protein